MDSEVVQKAEIILSNKKLLAEFADLNRMTPETATTLLERLVREPVDSEQAERERESVLAYCYSKVGKLFGLAKPRT
ncbi:hypothetical protein [Halopseudomonas pelagia]|uniref:Uncharacterized protein n=1 Tax=Halopseudomonas pelagia TaxID=553151 RepID=A0AA91Z588_9GAMM|nr:hypothetical protein [Halopseudomonas pelagia]PCC98325.1 hypothetical protein CO192_16190 [Halopseudomonas pelagia]QFY56662.1 hypothetical protein EAO82_09930 [Halopseudomonas pelagia]